MPTRFGETQHQFLTPTPQRQTAFVGAAFTAAPIGGILRNPRSFVRSWRFGASTIQSVTELAGALPALGSSHKFGVRYGGAGVTTIGETALGAMYMGGMPEASLPIPTFGFGITAVPVTSSRLVYEQKKSRPGEHTRRTSRVAGPLKTGKSMPGASAQKRKSSTSSKKGRGSGARLRVSRGHRLRKSRRTVPWCRVHNKRHYCRLTRKR